MITWRKIPGFSDHEVSENGKVRKALDFVPKNYFGPKLAPGHILKKQRGSGGYYVTTLMGDDGVRILKGIHVFVALAFIGPKPFKGAIVLHKDDNKINNHYTNLKWGTYTENLRDAELNGKRGKRPLNAKFSVDEVKMVKFLSSRGHSHRKIAIMYGVHIGTIGRIMRNKLYKDVT